MVNGNLLLLIICRICANQVYESIFATKGVWHYLDYPRYVGIFGHFCMIFSKLYDKIIFNIWEI